MKKNKLVLLFTCLIVLPFTSCSGNEVDPLIIKAVKSLRGKSHIVDLFSSVTLLKPNDDFAVDFYDQYFCTYGYYYDGLEKAYSSKINYIFADLVKETGQIMEGSTRYFSSSEVTYFKDNKDGTMYIEEISIENEYVSLTVADYNSSTGVYTPIIFDNEFRNPFDYISYRDYKVNNDGTLSLINEKADFLGECYNVVGLNVITENYIHLDDEGNIISMSFIINDLVEENYTRKNELTISFLRGDDIKLTHYAPYENDNPELQDALDAIDGKKNYTYSKEMSYKDYDPITGELTDYYDMVKGYFTEDAIFFHHQEGENDTHPYAIGDNYDYKAVLQDDGSYLCYEYNFSSNLNGYSWSPVSVSGSAYYTFSNFEEIGPQFLTIDASIFKKVDEYTYEIEDALLSSVGYYFDYGCMGVQSLALDGNTTKCIIHLNDNKQIARIETGFDYQNVVYDINYYLEDVDSTILPSWYNDITYIG